MKGGVAIVTGGGSGIGRALSIELAKRGAFVHVTDVNEKGAEATAKQIGASAKHAALDVRDAGAVQRFCDAVGRVDYLFNNAGIPVGGEVQDLTLAHWDRIIDINIRGVVHGVHAVYAGMVARGSGHIVNTASIAGILPGLTPSYDATKHAVVALTEDLYTTLTSVGVPVGVSVLCPGWVQTRIMDAERNWPDHLGAPPPAALGADIVGDHVRRAVAEGLPPAAVADLVAEAIAEERFWVFPHPDFVELAELRWRTIVEGQNPAGLPDVPGLPPSEQIAAEVAASLGGLTSD